MYYINSYNACKRTQSCLSELYKFCKKCKATEIVLHFQFLLYPYKMKIVKYFFYFKF